MTKKELQALGFFNGNQLHNDYIKKILFTELDYPYACSNCGLDEWMSEPISLELDHIDGNSSNVEIDNLRLLCPNCHSQTLTFRGKNKNNFHQRMVSDTELLYHLKSCSTIKDALITCGMKPNPSNYAKAYKLLYEDISPRPN